MPKIAKNTSKMGNTKKKSKLRRESPIRLKICTELADIRTRQNQQKKLVSFVDNLDFQLDFEGGPPQKMIENIGNLAKSVPVGKLVYQFSVV